MHAPAGYDSKTLGDCSHWTCQFVIIQRCSRTLRLYLPNRTGNCMVLHYYHIVGLSWELNYCCCNSTLYPQEINPVLSFWILSDWMCQVLLSICVCFMLHIQHSVGWAISLHEQTETSSDCTWNGIFRVDGAAGGEGDSRCVVLLFLLPAAVEQQQSQQQDHQNDKHNDAGDGPPRLPLSRIKTTHDAPRLLEGVWQAEGGRRAQVQQPEELSWLIHY